MNYFLILEEIYLKYPFYTNYFRNWRNFAMKRSSLKFRIGNGYDIHRLIEGRKLILGGVKLEHPENLGLEGHSDADVLTHSIMDALLGALSLGDIGKYFPPSDEK